MKDDELLLLQITESQEIKQRRETDKLIYIYIWIYKYMDDI